MKRYDFDMEFFGHRFHTGCFDNVNDFDSILLQTICRAFSHFKDATGIFSEFVEADCTRMAHTTSEERFVFYSKAAKNWGHQLTVSYIMRGTDSFLPRRKYAHDFEDVKRLRAWGYTLAGIRWSRGSQKESISYCWSEREEERYWRLDIDKPGLYAFGIDNTFEGLTRCVYSSIMTTVVRSLLQNKGLTVRLTNGLECRVS